MACCSENPGANIGCCADSVAHLRQKTRDPLIGDPPLATAEHTPEPWSAAAHIDLEMRQRDRIATQQARIAALEATADEWRRTAEGAAAALHALLMQHKGDLDGCHQGPCGIVNRLKARTVLAAGEGAAS